MTVTIRRKKKLPTDEGKSQKRDVTSPTRCVYCKSEFWAPNGKWMCPRCGKYLIVIDGVNGSMTGFFSKLLEGIAESGGVSEIEVSVVRRRD